MPLLSACAPSTNWSTPGPNSSAPSRSCVVPSASCSAPETKNPACDCASPAALRALTTSSAVTWSAGAPVASSPLDHAWDGSQEVENAKTAPTIMGTVKSNDHNARVVREVIDENLSTTSALMVKAHRKCSYFLVANTSRTRAPSSSDRKSTRLNSSHVSISYAVFCLNRKNYE